MKCCSIAYLPSPTDKRFGSSEFLKNLRDNPPAGDLILFSDHDQPDAPECIRVKGTFDRPDLLEATIQRPGSNEVTPNRAAINNLIWLTALRIVEKQGYSHFIYLEEDCRVRNPVPSQSDYAASEEPPVHETHWDVRIFKEFFDTPRHLIMAGSCVSYNPYNHTMESARRFERFLKETEQAGRKMPIPIYGWLSAASGQGSLLFPNGAGSVFSVAGVKMLFPERDSTPDTKIARENWAWDLTVGSRAWARFEAGVYDLIGYLPSIFSSYGNVLTSPEGRLAMLDQGYSLVHQCKTSK